jgi:hypothetical protein
MFLRCPMMILRRQLLKTKMSSEDVGKEEKKFNHSSFPLSDRERNGFVELSSAGNHVPGSGMDFFLVMDHGFLPTSHLEFQQEKVFFISKKTLLK